MNSILQNLDQPELEDAMNANHAAFWMALAGHASDIGEHYRDSKIAWLSSPINFSYPYNLVMPLKLSEADQDEAIAAATERAKKRQVTTEWWISPVHMNGGLGQ